jgi:hypothetical protein
MHHGRADHDDLAPPVLMHGGCDDLAPVHGQQCHCQENLLTL